MELNNQNKLSYREWILTLLLSFIPIVNIVFLIKWSADSNNPRVNFARAFGTLLGTFLTIILLSIILLIILLFDTNYLIDKKMGLQEEKSYEQLLNKTNDELSMDIEIIEVKLIQPDPLIGEYGFAEVEIKVKNNSNENSYTGFVLDGNYYDSQGSILKNFEYVVKDNIPPTKNLLIKSKTFEPDAVSLEITNIYTINEPLINYEIDTDCSDFVDSIEATIFMNTSKSFGYGDHDLDRDGDGVACNR